MRDLIILACIFSISLSGCAIAAQKRRLDYVSHHPELDSRVKESILNGEIELGMTKEQVIATWGHPVEINQLDGSPDFDEQWVYYSNSESPHTCPIIALFFKDGIVASWGECG